jgi:electron transfer flavoprotein alpha subunit
VHNEVSEECVVFIVAPVSVLMYSVISRRLFAGHAFVLADCTPSGTLNKSTLHAVGAARIFAHKITVGVLHPSGGVASEAASINGVHNVIHVTGSSELAELAAEHVAAAAAKFAATHILGTTSAFAKDVLPRVGALLDSQPISDVIGIESDSKFRRPMYAGNVVATVESGEKVKVMTIRPTSFAPVDATGGSATVESFSPDTVDVRAKLIGTETSASDKPDLASARVVISGGRGLKSKDQFESVLSPLADKLRAALGASRAAVDAGYAPNELQVGQTGKVVAPDLYIAVGISGAIQHVAGMKDSKTIVAINKDGDAPIFQIADYGIVGDLFQVVPELVQKLDK